MQYRHIDTDNSLAQSMNVTLNGLWLHLVAQLKISFSTFLSRFIFHHGNNADDMPDENDLASFNALV